MRSQPKSIGVFPSKMPVSMAIRKAIKYVPTGAGTLRIKPHGEKNNVYTCLAEGRRLKGLFNKIDKCEGVQLRVEPNVDWHPNRSTYLRRNGSTLNRHFRPQTRGLFLAFFSSSSLIFVLT